MTISCECGLDESSPVEVPLLQLKMPGIKCAIRKNKCWQEQVQARRNNYQAGVHKPVTGGLPRRPLTISIPQENEELLVTQGSKVKSVSNHADTNEAGSFYGVTLKQGPIRRANEDRVLFPFANLTSL